MLGYITPKREELKVKEFDRYRGFYCGLCFDLKKNCGEAARLSLTYDMTFLAILLTSLYDTKTSSEMRYCILHPLQKKLVIHNKYTEYAAKMSLMMTYQNLADDWYDEKKTAARVGAEVLKRAYKKTAAEYPRQRKALNRYIKKLHEVEEAGSTDLDKAAGLTGEFFKEIFIYDEHDVWASDLGEVGFYIGKFIYLMDAYEDIAKDKKSGSYNPFISYLDRDDFEDFARDVLLMMPTRAAAAFERLPLVGDTEILRNIIYAGIWNKYEELKNKKDKSHD